MTGTTGGRHAVVIGASIAGLVGAAALSRHFAQVTVLERDVLDPAQTPADWRRGVPQSRHVHILLARGAALIEQYCPGFHADAAAAGAASIDMAGDTAWWYAGGYKTRFASGIAMHCQSKGALERTLRGRVAALPAVTLRPQAEVRGLVQHAGRVRGVTLADGTTRDADLVVDAAGRGSRTAGWLAEAGFGTVPVSEIGVDVGYASRFVRPLAGRRDWRAAIVHPTPPGARIGIAIPVEGERWLVTLVGAFGDHPPGDDAGFLAFAKSLEAPQIGSLVEGAELLSPVALHRLPSSQRRRYEALPVMPDGLAVIGDAACSFNPIYGQGMSAAALGAATLDAALRADDPLAPGFSARFQRRLAHELDQPWLVSAAEDLRSPKAEGPRARWHPLLHWYTARIHALSWREADAALAFLKVMHLLERPGSLFRPSLAWRAVLHGGRAKGPQAQDREENQCQEA